MVAHYVFLFHNHPQHRRLDIIVVPYAEYPCALLYFTGSGHFNRSMRSKAQTMVSTNHLYCITTTALTGYVIIGTCTAKKCYKKSKVFTVHSYWACVSPALGTREVV